MVKISETPLPGVGARFDLTPVAGRPIGVVSRPSGRRDLLVYRADDPDAVEVTVPLAPDEAAAVADLLGGRSIVEEIDRLPTLVQGLAIDWVSLPSGRSARTIGDLAIRSATGASVIAIVRDAVALPAPGPDDELRGGDTVLLVGTPEGLEAAGVLLTG